MSYPHTRVKPHVQIPKKSTIFGPFVDLGAGLALQPPASLAPTDPHSSCASCSVQYSMHGDARSCGGGSFGAPERSEAELRCFDM